MPIPAAAAGIDSWAIFTETQGCTFRMASVMHNWTRQGDDAMTTLSSTTRSLLTAAAFSCLLIVAPPSFADEVPVEDVPVDVIDTGTEPGDPMVVIDDGAVIDTGVNPGDPIVVVEDGGDNPEIMQNTSVDIPMPNQRNLHSQGYRQSASAESLSSSSGTVIRHRCSFLKPCKSR
jgi:hypothetical protein